MEKILFRMINATKKWIFLKLSSLILIPLMLWFLYNLVGFYDKTWKEKDQTVAVIKNLPKYVSKNF